MAQMTTVYVTCQVLPGLFDTEYYVLVNGSSAYYISRDNVIVAKPPKGDQSVRGKVRSYLIATKKNKSLIQLPGEPIVGGLRTWVESTSVVTA